jgi:hypothetical protein
VAGERRLLQIVSRKTTPVVLTPDYVGGVFALKKRQKGVIRSEQYKGTWSKKLLSPAACFLEASRILPGGRSGTSGRGGRWKVKRSAGMWLVNVCSTILETLIDGPGLRPIRYPRQSRQETSDR